MRPRPTIFDIMRKEMEEMIQDRDFMGFFDYPRTELIEGQDNNKELTNYRRPLSDIWQTEKEVIANIELPGVDKKDIDINVEKNKLEVKVEKKTEEKDKNRYMSNYSGFYKCFSLPENVNSDQAQATYNNGILEIKIPKKEIEKKQVKKIDIK